MSTESAAALSRFRPEWERWCRQHDRCDAWLASGEQRLTAAPRASKWSMAQHLHHTALASLFVAERMTELLATPGDAPHRGYLTFPGRLMLFTGWIPRGVGKAPDRTRPPEAVVPWPEIERVVRLASATVRGLEPRLPELAVCQAHFQHPVAGLLSLRQWARFSWIHANHHLKIVEDLRREWPR